jgi:drug/metabolite transporter (DMT)-like permease
VILWAILIGIFAWGEHPDLLASFGIALVIAAGLASFVRERRIARMRAEAATLERLAPVDA